jgi:hypothetical protein
MKGGASSNADDIASELHDSGGFSEAIGECCLGCVVRLLRGFYLMFGFYRALHKMNWSLRLTR